MVISLPNSIKRRRAIHMKDKNDELKTVYDAKRNTNKTVNNTCHDDYKAADDEIKSWIEDYGFRLPDENPKGGGFVCDYFPELEEDKELQKRILYNHYRIYELLMEEYMRRERSSISQLRG